MSTTWTKHAKEAFSVDDKASRGINQNSNASKHDKDMVVGFDRETFVGNDPNEVILRNNPAIPIPTSSSTETPSPNSTDNPKQDSSANSIAPYQDLTLPSTWNELTSFFKKFDKNKAKQMYDSVIIRIKNGINGFKGNVAETVVGWFHETFESPEAKKDIEIISDQFSIWFNVVIVSYFILINWWYVMAYTNFTIDFRDYTWSPLKYCMGPSIYALESMNRIFGSFRMDADAEIPFVKNSVGFVRLIWNWRPITFTLFHFLLAMMLHFLPMTDVASTIMINGGPLFAILTVLSVVNYLTMYVSEKWYEPFIKTVTLMGLLVLVAMTIATFLSIFALVSILSRIFLLYIIFLSYMALITFKWFWPPSIWRVYKQIFDDLKGAPVDNENPINKSDKAKNLAFRRFHSLYALAIYVGLVGINVYKMTSFSNPSLIVVLVLIHLFILYFFMSGPLMVMYEFFNILIGKSSEVVSNIPIPETSIQEAIPVPIEIPSKDAYKG